MRIDAHVMCIGRYIRMAKPIPRPALRGEGEVKSRQGGARGKEDGDHIQTPFFLTFWFLQLVEEV